MADCPFCYKDKNNVLAGLLSVCVCFLFCFVWFFLRGGGIMAGAGRMEEKEEVGKVVHVAQHNAAIHSDFRVRELVLTG